MAKTFYFYDLETSGFNPREARIMQFGGQRTNLALKPIGEPHSILVKMTEDVLPDPEAILVTGITPQKTRAEGVSEVEFLRLFHEEIAVPDTIFVGFNSIRFDDEFMRYLHYRNFYDPYEWQWKDGRSRWDLLDVVRMTRALRPQGIKWPFDTNGAASNRLMLLTGLNKLEHLEVHDALSDVQASIAVARLVYNKHTKLFDYLLSMRTKQKVAELVGNGQPFVYTSGKYPSEFEKTTVAVKIAEHPKRQGILVYDLRHDPAEVAKLTPSELAESWHRRRDDEGYRLPVKTLQFNRCPAVAPLSVLDADSQSRLKLDVKLIQKNHQKLKAQKGLKDRLFEALELLDQQRQTALLPDELDVDAQLYDGFFSDQDRVTSRAVRAAEPADLASFSEVLTDDRLQALLPLYKARNFPKTLDAKERVAWEDYRQRKLLGGKAPNRLQRYGMRLEELAQQSNLTGHQKYLLEELHLYAQSLTP